MMHAEALAQRWSASNYEAHARFVSDLSGDVMAWLDPKEGERILDLGCGVRRIGLFPRPTPLKTGMGEWLKLFRKPFFNQFESEAENALAQAMDLLRPSLCDSHGNWTADYVRLRVEAVK